MKYFLILSVMLFASCHKGETFVDTKDVHSKIVFDVPDKCPTEPNIYIRKGINVDVLVEGSGDKTHIFYLNVYSEVQDTIYTLEISDNKSPWMDIAKTDMQTAPSTTCFKYRVWSESAKHIYFAPL